MIEIRTQYVEPVMFTCEVKNAPVRTGHRMRAREFAALVGPRSFRCDGCGFIHTWTVETAWLGVQHPVTESAEGKVQAEVAPEPRSRTADTAPAATAA